MDPVHPRGARGRFSQTLGMPWYYHIGFHMLCLFVLLIYGWIILNMPDCVGLMYTYVRVVTIFSTVQACLIVLACLVFAFCPTMPGRWGLDAIMDLVAVVSSLAQIAWFIWGIILLAQHHCYLSSFFYYTIVAVVLSGLGILGLFRFYYWHP